MIRMLISVSLALHHPLPCVKKITLVSQDLANSYLLHMDWTFYWLGDAFFLSLKFHSISQLGKTIQPHSRAFCGHIFSQQNINSLWWRTGFVCLCPNHLSQHLAQCLAHFMTQWMFQELRVWKSRSQTLRQTWLLSGLNLSTPNKSHGSGWHVPA